MPARSPTIQTILEKIEALDRKREASHKTQGHEAQNVPVEPVATEETTAAPVAVAEAVNETKTQTPKPAPAAQKETARTARKETPRAVTGPSKKDLLREMLL